MKKKILKYTLLAIFALAPSVALGDLFTSSPIIYQIPPDTTIPFDLATASTSATAPNIFAEKIKVNQNTQVCSIYSFVQAKHSTFPNIGTHSSPGTSWGFEIYEGTSMNSATARTGSSSKFTNVVDMPDYPPASPSWQGNALTNIANGNPCFTLLATSSYFLFANTHGSSGTQQFVKYFLANRTSNNTQLYARYGTSTDWRATNFDMSIQLFGTFNGVNFNFITGGLNSSSYNFSSASSSKDFGTLGNYFRDILVYLFQPSASIFQSYTSLYDGIRHKPPIGYVDSFVSASAGFSGGTDNLHLASNSFTNTLKTGMAWILWILLAFAIIKRVAHMDI